jgi:hypothetical protein
MKTGNRNVAQLLIIAAALIALPLSLFAWEPSAAARDAALRTGDFDPYVARLGAWVSAKVPSTTAGFTSRNVSALLKAPKFLNAVVERKFITRVWGKERLSAWANRSKENREFVRWIMSQPGLMDAVLLARTPTAEFARVDDSWSVSLRGIEEWKNIYYSDRDSRKGVYLKLAVACILRPPGSANRGAGETKEQSSIYDRYRHYRDAHKQGELFPSFDTLSIWEMTHVVSASASNADLAWGREALNTWKPSFRENENVVAMVGQVWRRGSQVPYNDMSCVAAGGGKCGPRSSFGVFINQAFGIPSIGVGQPAHAAITFRGRDGEWHMAQGRGFHVSKISDRFRMSGNDFLKYVKERRSPDFARGEHLRWLAGILEDPKGGYVPPADRRYKNPRAAAVYALRRALRVVEGKIENTPFRERKADSSSSLRGFQSPMEQGEHYFARVRGFVYPPKTGEYTFAISGDDAVDLFLSKDEDPTNRELLVSLTSWTKATDFGHKSKPVHLVAGQRYYIEGVHDQQGGGDHLFVAWSGPGMREAVIPGRYLSPYTRSGRKGSIRREVWKKQAAAPLPPARVEFKPEAPIKVAPGVIHVEAEEFFTKSEVAVENCYTGGKQLFFPPMRAHSMVGYKVKVPKTGTYQFSARVATINWGQQMYVRSFGAMYPVKEARASNVFRNQEFHGPQQAIDHDLTTRWAMDYGKEDGWLELDLGKPRKISKLIIDERALNYVCRHRVEYQVGGEWKTLLEGEFLKNYVKEFPPVRAQKVRLRTFEAKAQTGGPTLRDFSVGDVMDGNGFFEIPWGPALEKDKDGVAGLWQTSAPMDLYLVKGEQVVWVCTQTLQAQRSIAMRWFQLKPKG